MLHVDVAQLVLAKIGRVAKANVALFEKFEHLVENERVVEIFGGLEKFGRIELIGQTHLYSEPQRRQYQPYSN